MKSSNRIDALMISTFLIVLATTTSACAPPEREEKEVRCHPPLERIIIGSEEILIYPAASSDWRALVVLPSVEDIRYAVTFEQARRLWGPPRAVSKDIRERTETYFSARRKLSVVWSRQASGTDAFESWYLYVYPRNAKVEESFHQSVFECLPSEKNSHRVLVIMDPQHRRPTLQAMISDGYVQSFLWFPPPPPTVLPRPNELDVWPQ